jgi:hypothetical protein
MARIGKITVGQIIVSEIKFFGTNHSKIEEAKGTVIINGKRKPFHIHHLIGHWRMPYRQQWASGLMAEEIRAVFEKIADACQKKMLAQKPQGEIKPS